MRRGFVAILIAAAILTVGVRASFAQWVPTGGPSCEYVSSLLVVGSKVFAGTDQVLFVSEAGPYAWAPAGAGLAEREVHCLIAAGPSLFAGVDWPDYNAEGVPRSAKDLLTRLRNAVLGGVVRSDDGGLTWAPAHAGLPFRTNVRSFALLGKDLYVGTDVDEEGADEEIGNMEEGVGGGGIFVTRDLGKAWQRTGNFSAPFLASAGPALFAESLIEGFIRSNDGGMTWASGGAFSAENVKLCLVRSGSNLVLGTSQGLFVSTDDGAHWKASTAGLPAKAAVRRLAAGDGRVFAATASRVFVSDDDGLRWKEAGTGLPAGITIWSLAAGPTGVFVGTEGQGVWRLPAVGANASKRP